jgi:acetylornithine deacetylase/succinyl-diaminopimelate desuccinylase-like protein
LGSADDKSGVAIVLAAARLLAEAGAAPGVALIHGKAGGSRGTLPALLALRRSYRAALYLHPAETGAGLREIKHSSRGVLDIELEVQGWRGQAREIGTPQSASFTEGGNAIGECIRLCGEMQDALPTRCAWNLGALSGGTHAGVVPAMAVAQARVLFDAPYSVETLQSVLDECVRPRDGYQANLRYAGLRAQAAHTDWNDPWCRTVRTAVEQVTGLMPAPYGFHLASDLRFPIRLLGIPAVGLGPTGGAFYSANEWVDTDDMLRALAVTLLAAAH